MPAPREYTRRRRASTPPEIPLNYLAHALLGDHGPDGLAGSVMGDFVKGRLDGTLPAAIEHAVRVHRRVDTFTDAHPVHRRSRRRFEPPRRRFAGVIVDVAYDHFLCRHWDRFAPVPLEAFVASVYRALESRRRWLPERLRRIAPRMAREDWLGGYRHAGAVARALDGIAARRPRAAPLAGGGAEVRRHYAALEADFLEFFPDALEAVEGSEGDGDGLPSPSPSDP